MQDHRSKNEFLLGSYTDLPSPKGVYANVLKTEMKRLVENLVVPRVMCKAMRNGWLPLMG